MDKLEGLVAAQREMIDSLADKVRILEGRVSRGHLGRVNHSSGLSCSTGTSRSSGDSSYGTPGEQIHQSVAVPERLEGFVGDGSEEHLYTNIIVDQIEDLDDLNL